MEDISATPKKKTIREGLHSLKSSPEKNAKPVEETPAKLTKSGFDLKTAETQKVKSSVSVPSSIAEKSAVKEKNGSVTLQETPQERKIPKRSVVPLSQPKPPPPPAFEPPVVRKKVKKKSWLGISGYQSINHGASDGEIHSTESSGQQMVKSASQEPLDPKLISFYNKHCLPLYIITLRPGSSTVSRPPDDIGQRYFLDVQLGLFFGHNSGRAFLNSCPGITTRVAHTAEKEELETTPAAETVYSAMLHANASAAKWIKWIPTEIGSGKGLKMSDLDVHFVKEEDVRDKIALRMSRLREEWLDLNTDQPGRFTEELELTGTLSRRESVSSLVDLQAPETPVLAAAPPSLEERGDSHTGEKEGLVDTPEPSSTQSVVPSAPIHPAATPSEPEAPSSFYVHKLKRFK